MIESGRKILEADIVILVRSMNVWMPSPNEPRGRAVDLLIREAWLTLAAPLRMTEGRTSTISARVLGWREVWGHHWLEKCTAHMSSAYKAT